MLLNVLLLSLITATAAATTTNDDPWAPIRNLTVPFANITSFHNITRQPAILVVFVAPWCSISKNFIHDVAKSPLERMRYVNKPCTHALSVYVTTSPPTNHFARTTLTIFFYLSILLLLLFLLCISLSSLLLFYSRSSTPPHFFHKHPKYTFQRRVGSTISARNRRCRARTRTLRSLPH